MAQRGIVGFFCFLLICFALQNESRAQFRQLPVSLRQAEKKPVSSQLRVQQETPSLPFWDDFSSGKISESKWLSKGAIHSYTIGNNPPSVGMVFLDGMDDAGNPYSRSRLENGEGDELQSLPLDLSGLDAEDQNSVFISFFWQAGGKGEMPDSQDALILSFLDGEGNWISAWTQEGGEELGAEGFQQAILPVPPEFQHANFQFKFTHSGRLSGPFDTWVLDYILLNKGREEQDLFTNDRSLTRLPGSPFSPYYAIPYFEFNPELISGTIQNQFNNLGNRFRAMEYTVELRDLTTGNLVARPDQNTPVNPVAQAGERRDFFSTLPEDLDLIADNAFDLEVFVQLLAGDDFLVASVEGQDTLFHEGVDFRINDTISTVIPFRDYYAYDNGHADYAAGINQRGGMLALEYQALNPGYLSGISINFTNLAQRGNAIELMVWDSLENEPLLREEVLIPEGDGLASFAYFPIDTNILVQDTFYVGFAQYSNEYLYVGLDKSGDTGERVYFNVLGSWQQNEEVSGNLMIRPHLSQTPVQVEPEEIDSQVRIYPNPVEDRLLISGQVNGIEVFDFQGRLIKVPQEGDKNGKMLNFTGIQKGMYLIKFTQAGRAVTKRIIVR
ncbi:T9SS type A sorting domain-containing protein [Cyclobacterium jeungdonense]|uniref:T9SS type A sorting domain-containing protein n=1 Tax=Cyclobacterium jeungdonense TaxID=708087 RepID=A0ABT8C3N6_9BACT|nr:T9SS type A sorting domain-containing protein [Cyclobacterium jeungdonense]MDN3687385.1 T9SS type A sorting domain-containing protein [Cyclobacterium jeungdonense]